MSSIYAFVRSGLSADEIDSSAIIQSSLMTALAGVLDVSVNNIGAPVVASLLSGAEVVEFAVGGPNVVQQPEVFVEFTATSSYNAADVDAALSVSKNEFRAIFITTALGDGYEGDLSDTKVILLMCTYCYSMLPLCQIARMSASIVSVITPAPTPEPTVWPTPPPTKAIIASSVSLTMYF